MLTHRTQVHSAGQRRSVFLARHHFELWPSTYLVWLVLRITRAISSSLASDPDSKLQFNPTRATYFLLASDPSATFLADPSQDSSPSYSRLTFGRHSSQTFPQDTSPSCSSLTFEQPTLWNRLARSCLRETTALPFQTISTRTQFDLRETSIKIFMLSLTVYFC